MNELKREKQHQQIALFLKFSLVYARPQPPHKERIHGLKIDASEFFSLGQMVIETMLDFEHVFLLIVLGTQSMDIQKVWNALIKLTPFFIF